MKKAYSLLISIFIMILAVGALVSCTPPPKTIKEVYIVSAVDEEVQVGDFDIANYRVRLIMTDGTDKYVDIKDNMLNVNLEIFQEVGEHNLSVIYNNNMLTLKIKIIDKIYCITYETNGGSILAPVNDSKIMDLPITSKNNFKFAGWYLNEEFSGAQVLFPLSVTEDITLYARWAEDAIPVHQVNFDFNYDQAIIYTPQFIPNGQKVVSPEFLVREGYEIAFWHLEGGSLWDFSEDLVEGNITLVAEWEAA